MELSHDGHFWRRRRVSVFLYSHAAYGSGQGTTQPRLSNEADLTSGFLQNLPPLNPRTKGMQRSPNEAQLVRTRHLASVVGTFSGVDGLPPFRYRSCSSEKRVIARPAE